MPTEIEKLQEKEGRQRCEELKQASLPLIKYMAENYHPHVTAIVTSTSVELLEGICSIPKIYDFIGD